MATPIGKDVSLEHLQRQGYYKLCFKCEQNRPGILYALTRVLHDKIEANIYSLSAYSPQNKRIEDYLFFNANRNRSFKEIDKLYRIMGKWNLYIFARRRFANPVIAYTIYQTTLALSNVSMFLFYISPKLERKLMERIKKFSYRFKFRKGDEKLN